MYTIREPLSEEEILAPVAEEASGAEVKQDMETKAQCCVDHLCGCTPDDD